MPEPLPPPADPPADLPRDMPAGWLPHTRHSPLTRPWEPIYAQARPAQDGRLPALALALRVAEAHCNAKGFAHGGLLSALADNAMGLSAGAAALAAAQAKGATPPAGAVTVSLQLDFLDSARPGEWLVFSPQVLRHGRSLAFTECHVQAEGRLVARASATFRLL